MLLNVSNLNPFSALSFTVRRYAICRRSNIKWALIVFCYYYYLILSSYYYSSQSHEAKAVKNVMSSKNNLNSLTSMSHLCWFNLLSLFSVHILEGLIIEAQNNKRKCIIIVYPVSYPLSIQICSLCISADLILMNFIYYTLLIIYVSILQILYSLYFHEV